MRAFHGDVFECVCGGAGQTGQDQNVCVCVCVCVFALRVRKSVKMWSECVCGYDCMKCVCVCDHLLNK